MKQSILKRFPSMGENDVTLRDDGKGVFIDVWKSKDPKPTMAQVNAWVAEDAQQPKPKTELELMQRAIDDIILGGLI